jgi:dTDP-4-dehydrorhamnose reductase
VIGASGLVGTALMERLGSRALGTYRGSARPRLEQVDVADATAVKKLLERTAPRAVVHAAAWTHVDGCEQDPERSQAINVDGTRNVAHACAEVGARMIFISSDYVFGDGDGPHAIDETPAPLNVYGRHKLAAERIVSRTVGDHVIVRSCNVYGYQAGGKNFVMAVRDCGRAGRPFRAPADQWGNPTLAEDLSGALARLVDSDLRGVLHLAGPDYVDRPTWARLAAEAFGLDPGFMSFVPTSALAQPARRPLHAGLDSTDSYLRAGLQFTPLGEALRRVAEQAAAHP